LELHVLRQVLGPPRCGAMDLRNDAIENADLVAMGEKLVGNVRSDEARAAGDEYGAAHRLPPRASDAETAMGP